MGKRVRYHVTIAADCTQNQQFSSRKTQASGENRGIIDPIRPIREELRAAA
jgi:hypothetical protein